MADDGTAPAGDNVNAGGAGGAGPAAGAPHRRLGTAEEKAQQRKQVLSCSRSILHLHNTMEGFREKHPDIDFLFITFTRGRNLPACTVGARALRRSAPTLV